MQLSDYLAILRKRWWIIVLVCASAAVVGYGYSKMQPKVYRASAKLLAEPNRSDYGLDLFIKSSLTSYKVYLTTRDFAQRAIDRARVDAPVDLVLTNLRVAVNPDEHTVLLTVDDISPRDAQLLADAAADEAIEEINGKNATKARSDLQVNLVKIDKPVLPTNPDRPNTRTNVMAAGLFGLLLGLLLAFVLEYVDDSIKTAEDVTRYLDLPTIGAIPPLAGADGKAGTRRWPAAVPGGPR